jgi:hypothetical protein
VDPTDGVGRVVTSGGNTVESWKLQNSSTPSLTNVSNAGITSGGQDPGFLTSISSNGTANPIIWALGRPASQQNDTVYLYAFNPDAGGSNMTQLFRGPAGTWPNVGGNSNLVPVVANGKVYVAAYKTLEVFAVK